MPKTPPRKQPINIQEAFDDENPASISDFFELGSILYSDENSCDCQHYSCCFPLEQLTMTPALKLNEHDKKASLSCMLKFLLLGIMRIKMSTNMIEAPNMQAKQSQSCRVISDWCF